MRALCIERANECEGRESERGKVGARSPNMCFQIPLKASIVVEFLSLCVLSS